MEREAAHHRHRRPGRAARRAGARPRRDARGPRGHVPRPLRRHDARRQHRQHRRRRRRADPAPPVVSRAWSAIAMHDEFWPPVEAKLRPGGARARERHDVHERRSAPTSTVHRVPATTVATELGNPLGGVDGDARRVLRDDRHRRRRRARSRRCARRSRRTGRSTSKPTNARSAPGWELLPAGAFPAWEVRPMSDDADTITSRGTVTIDVEHCKGCELCIPACPPRVLDDVDARSNHMGYRYPELHPGCTGCAACLLVCPDFVFEVFRFDDAASRVDGGAGMTARPTTERVLMEGSEALARAAIAAGCRFFAGYPMTPFTEVLEHFATPAARRRRRVHQRRVGARSRRHGVGRARDRRRAPRPARPARASRSCRSRSPRSRSPSCRSSSSTWRAASRTTSRRRAAAATATTGTSCSRRRTCAKASSTCSSRSTSPTSGAIPVLVYGDYLLAHTQEAVAIEPIDVPRRSRRRTGRSTASQSGTGRSRQRHAARRRQGRPARDRPGRQGAVHRDEDPVHGTRGARRDRLSRRRGDRDRRVRLAGQVREVRDRAAARRRAPHRLRPPDHAVAVPVRRGRATAARRERAPRRQLRAVRRPDDRRRAHRRRRPGAGRRSSAASRPTTPASASAASSTST